MKDNRFSHTVIFICGHDAQGAMGLVINHVTENFTLKDLLGQLELPEVKVKNSPVVMQGGPVEIGRGFVLHSPDYSTEATVKISDHFALTATTEILTEIAEGKGPKDSLIMLGYAGWGAGQLEHELERSDWLPLKADPQIVFKVPFEQRWSKTLAQAGIDPAMLADESGHC